MKIIILVTLFITLFVWNLILQISPEKQGLTNFLFNLSYALVYFYSGLLALWGLASSEKSQINKGLKFLGLGLISWSIGGVVWVIYNLVLKVEIPYPSLADLFFFAFLPLTIAGFWQILSVYKTGLNTKIYFQAGLVILGGFLISIFLISRPDLSPDVPLLARILNIAYPTGDAIFLAIAFILYRLSAGGQIQKVFLILAAASTTQVIADYLFSYRTSSETYWNGDISDLFYMTSAVIFGVGVIKLKDLISF